MVLSGEGKRDEKKCGSIRIIEGRAPEQPTYLPECLGEVIAPDNPIRFIRLFALQLDPVKMGFVRSKPKGTDRPGYDPAVLLMLYICGHMNRIRSSRRPERECRRNIELWWLLGKLEPDHNTIADFRKDNKKALKGLLRAFVRLCVEMGLTRGARVCVDGTPIQAVNGLKQSTNIELSRKKLDYAQRQLALVEEYLKDLDEADKIDQGRLNKAFALDIDPKRLPHLHKPLHRREDLQDGEVRAPGEVRAGQDVRKPRTLLQQIPGVTQPDHNHVFGHIKRAPARVMVFIRRSAGKLKERFRVSEHPFGTIKFYDGAHCFLCKGRGKVAAETSLMFTSYNIRRAITPAGGVQNLIGRMTEAIHKRKS